MVMSGAVVMSMLLQCAGRAQAIARRGAPVQFRWWLRMFGRDRSRLARHGRDKPRHDDAIALGRERLHDFGILERYP
jgi:hypothetical protein